MPRWFLSYNSQDLALAERLEAALKSKDPAASIFFAPKKLRAGGYWLPQLADEIAAATAFVLLVGEKGLGPWQVDEYYEARDRRVPVVLVLLEGQPAPGLPFLRTLHWIVTPDPASEQSIARLIDAVAGGGVTPGELWRHAAPYRGLAAMTEADSDFFVGRARETVEVLKALEGNPDRLPLLLGNSGVGKSSLCQAGALSCLKRQAWPDNAEAAGAWPAAFRDSRRWCFLTLRPGAEPLKALIEPFLRTWQIDATDPLWARRHAEWTEALLEGALSLRALLDATERRYEELHQPPPPAFFLYVDQGEELYVRAEERQRRRFSRILVEALGDPRLRALMSLRADFCGALQNDEPLYQAHLQINVPPLREAELREVVSRPAALLSARFETETLASDIARRAAEESAKDAGALPLLSYLLDDMWTQMVRRGDGVMRLPPHAMELGGVLAERANAFLATHPDAEERLRRVLTLKLATVREDGEPTRRRAPRSEFSDEEWRLVSELADHPHRLLVTAMPEGGETYAEVAHEAIFRRWEKLREWLAAEREFLAWRSGLEADRHVWEAAPEPSRNDALLMGLALAQAQGWLVKRAEGLARADRDFIELSLTREARERKRNQRLKRRVLGVGMAALLLVTAFGGAAGFLWVDAGVNRARFFLQNNRLEAAQNELRDVWAHPLTRVLPASASARGLATQLLNTGLVETVSRLKLPQPGQILDGGYADLMRTNSGLFSLVKFAEAPALLRCSRGGEACEVMPLGKEWKSPTMVRDGDDLYVVEVNTQQKDGIVAKVSEDGRSRLAVRTISASGLIQFRRVGDALYWIGRGHLKELIGFGGVFSEQPPVQLKDIFGTEFPRFAMKDGVDPKSADFSGKAVCDQQLISCVTYTYTDARASKPRFDLWGTTGMTQPSTLWSKAVEALFIPLPSANRRAISDNGQWIAITENDIVHVWHRPDLTTHKRQTFRSLRLLEAPLALTFDERTEDLLILTGTRMMRLRLQPRSEWTTRPGVVRNERDSIGKTSNSVLLIREQDRSITAKSLVSGTEWPLTPPRESYQTVRLVPDTPIATILDDRRRQTVVVDAKPVPPSTHLVQGDAIVVLESGKAGIFYDADCRFLLWRAPDEVVPFSVEQFSDKCTRLSTYSDVIGFRRGPEDAVVRLPGNRFVRIGIGASGVPRISEIDAGEMRRKMWWQNDRFIYFSEKGELVVQSEGAGLRRSIIENEEIARLIASTLRADRLHVRYVGNESYIVFVDSSPCDRSKGGSLVLLVDRGRTVDAQFLLHCIRLFSSDPEGSWSGVGTLLADQKAFFGSYDFGGIFEWTPSSRDLKLYQFSWNTGEGRYAATRATLVPQPLGHGNTTRIDLSNLSEARGRGATTIAYSPDSRRLAYIFNTGGSAGHSKGVNVFDLNTMRVGLTENETRGFFDNVSNFVFSPKGVLLLTRKDEAGYELFRVRDLQRLSLPVGTVYAEFTSDESLRVALASGGAVIWHVPEAADREIAYLKGQLEDRVSASSQ